MEASLGWSRCHEVKLVLASGPALGQSHPKPGCGQGGGGSRLLGKSRAPAAHSLGLSLCQLWGQMPSGAQGRAWSEGDVP